MAARVGYVVRHLGSLLTAAKATDMQDESVYAALRLIADGQPSLLAAAHELQQLRAWKVDWERQLVRAGLPARADRTLPLAIAAVARASLPSTGEAEAAFAEGARYELRVMARLVGIAESEIDRLDDLHLRDAIAARRLDDFVAGFRAAQAAPADAD